MTAWRRESGAIEQHGGSMVAAWWRDSGGMVAAWWRQNGGMVALVDAPKPEKCDTHIFNCILVIG